MERESPAPKKVHVFYIEYLLRQGWRKANRTQVPLLWVSGQLSKKWGAPPPLAGIIAVLSCIGPDKANFPQKLPTQLDPASQKVLAHGSQQVLDT